MSSIITPDQSDAFIKNIKSNLNDVKIFYCPDNLFINDSLKYLNDISEKVLVSDSIYPMVDPIVQGTTWPTSQWERAIKDRPPKINGSSNSYSIASDTLQKKREDIHVGFVVNNDTHVKMFLPVARYFDNNVFIAFNNKENAVTYLKSSDQDYLDLDYHPPKRDQGYFYKLARRAFHHFFSHQQRKWLKNRMNRKGNYSPSHFLTHLDIKPDILLFGNDWGHSRMLIKEAKEYDIPTIVLQEGPQDFQLPSRPLMHAEYVLLQGIAHAKYLERDEFFVTGNPRLESMSDSRLPEAPVVMINSNFTYGIYENWRERWVNDIVSICNKTGIDFFISKHPRDNGKFPSLPVIDSNAFKVTKQINKASIVVSRFSQIVYEALNAGRPVIYYNPHGEDKKILTQEKSNAILYSENSEELESKIGTALEYSDNHRQEIKRFLQLHCCQSKETPERISKALQFISQ